MFEEKQKRKIKIDQVVIVEGKYDKIKLSRIIDAVIISTDGFRIYKDKDKLKMIKTVAEKNGVVILTDSDVAGFRIRHFLSGVLPRDNVRHIYIPQIVGKEKRKNLPSKENMIGVEGIDDTTLINCFEKFKVFDLDHFVEQNKDIEETNQNGYKKITIMDFYQDGLIGATNSKQKRDVLKRKLQLPIYLSSKSLLKVLNETMTYEQYKENIFLIYKDFDGRKILQNRNINVNENKL